MACVLQMYSREERATYLPDAFAPPGLEVAPEPAGASSSGSSSGNSGSSGSSSSSGGSSSSGSGKHTFVVTSPEVGQGGHGRAWLGRGQHAGGWRAPLTKCSSCV